MSVDFDTALGALAIVATISFAALVDRFNVTEAGAHRRAGSGETTVEVPIAALLPPWSPRREPDWPEPVHGAAVPQAFGFCPPCRRETAGVVSRDGWRCGECHLPTAVAA